MELQRYHRTVFGRPARTPGRHGYVAYHPAPIPRQIDITAENVMRLADAESALGRLAGAARLLPDPHILVNPYLRREAVASTRIEGTQASLAEVFDAEASERPLNADLEEVVNYVIAMQTGLEQLRSLPVSTRLIREMHKVILSGVRGRDRQPGELRTTQNWIGSSGDTLESAIYVPPPPDEVGALLDDLEQFVHEPPRLPPLVQAALLHYQFETIHPFLDGNGRLGRLFIVFFLVVRGRLPEPLLYLSPYLEAQRDSYYEVLQAVREVGAFDGWLAMFLDAVRVQATDAVMRAERLMDLREQYRTQVLARTRGLAVMLVDLVSEQPVLTSRSVEKRYGSSRPSSLRALRQLTEAGILEEVQGSSQQLRWRAPEVLRILTEETGDARPAPEGPT